MCKEELLIIADYTLSNLLGPVDRIHRRERNGLKIIGQKPGPGRPLASDGETIRFFKFFPTTWDGLIT